jgi:hypothetical protein
MPTKTEELRDDLITVAMAYCTAKKMALTSLGHYVHKNSRYFVNIRSGELRLYTEAYDKSMKWLSDNWPNDVAWPVLVDRPQPTKDRTNGTKTKDRRTEKGTRARAR